MALQLNPNTTEFEIIEYFLRKGAKKDGFCTDLVKHGLRNPSIYKITISQRQPFQSLFCTMRYFLFLCTFDALLCENKIILLMTPKACPNIQFYRQHQ
ncbi:hypothetical protein FCL47_21825 [Desulfopila sp. IMCC35006]|nr:hypothetical protein FCL47_21825 [Desulfopila sp. IMCC35006]